MADVLAKCHGELEIMTNFSINIFNASAPMKLMHASLAKQKTGSVCRLIGYVLGSK